MTIDNNLLDSLLEQAATNPRLRVNYDLRTSANDNSQRMLNAILPGSVIPVHRHTQSTEVICVLRGLCIQHLYDADGNEVEQVLLEANGPSKAMSVKVGQWHNLEVLEPTVIFEAKDGRYGEDGSETWAGKTDAGFCNSLGDLKKNIEYLISMDRHSGSMEVISPLYVSRMLNQPIEEVENAMKEMDLI